MHWTWQLLKREVRLRLWARGFTLSIALIPVGLSEEQICAGRAAVGKLVSV